MSLVQLVYVSRMAMPLSGKQIEDLGARAARKNALQDLSGLLIAGSGGFIQLLEGDPIRVIRLYDKIAADERHTAVEKVFFEEASTRIFGQWSMALLNLDAPKVPLNFTGVRTLNLMRDKWASVFENVPIAVEMLKRFREIAA